MEKRIAHSFYGLGTFVFFLYFMKVSSAPTPSLPPTFIDVMKSDKEMIPCVPSYLYESDIMKDCRNVVYPTEDQLHNKEYLCLAFYDTLYKACQNNQFQYSSFNNSATFNLYIKKFFPGEEEDDRTNFCESINGIAFSNKKLKLLSSVNINNTNVCYSVCFDSFKLQKFKPLCAILLWSKSIDDIIQRNKVQQTEPQSSTLNTKHTNSVVKKPKTNVPSTEEIQNSKPANVKTSDAPMVQEMPSTDEKTSAQKDVDKNIKEAVANNVNSSPAKKQEKTQANAVQVDGNNLEKPRLLSNENLENSKQIDDAKVNNADDDTERTKSNNMDAKLTTISEHTQDDENPVNQDDLMSDPNETDVQPNLTGDQGSLSSEQRNYGFNDPHYRTDEESHFFTYFTIISIISIAAYIGYHNKQKILAIVLEGRRTRNSRGRRTPRGSTANYHKLGTLEEAVTSQCNANVTHVIY